MLRKNEGTVDRAIRIVVGAALAPIGLFVLDGLQGSVVGIVAAAFGFWFVLHRRHRCVLPVHPLRD
jgi:hypothetical protein